MALGAPPETFPANSTLVKLALSAMVATPLVVIVCVLWAFGKVRAAPHLASFWPMLIPAVYGALAVGVLSLATSAMPPEPHNVSAPSDNAALTAWLAARSGVKEVSIRDAGLTEVPAPLLSVTSLEVLDLAGNRIAVLPDALRRLPRLRMLYLNGNPVAPAEIQRWIAASGYKGTVNQ
jgi:Leucine-rich repeat (LRR) protein